MKMDIIIEKNEQGRFKASCPAIPNCVAYGKTDSEARQNLKDEIVKCIKNRLLEGLPFCECGHECT